MDAVPSQSDTTNGNTEPTNACSNSVEEHRDAEIDNSDLSPPPPEDATVIPQHSIPPASLPEPMPTSDLTREDTDQTSPADQIYHIRWIDFRGESLPIIKQSLSGPCPIIAIANVLLLRKAITLSKESEIITGHRLVTLLTDRLLSTPPANLDESHLLNYETLVGDALNLFPRLQTGLDVNVRFTGVSSFEFTSALTVFDLFRIDLYHGWVIDANDSELASVVGDQSYNQLVEQVLELPKSTDPEIARRGLLAQDFLHQTASQLTYQGLCDLSSALGENQLAVFFRNNHFNTIYNHKNHIYLLVTDNSLLNEEPSIVWEALNDVDGNTQFVDALFSLFSPSSKDYKLSSPEASSSTVADVHDTSSSSDPAEKSPHGGAVFPAPSRDNSAARLKSQESLHATSVEGNRWPDQADIERDMELALRLQQEEFDMVDRGGPTAESQAARGAAASTPRTNSSTNSGGGKDSCSLV